MGNFQLRSIFIKIVAPKTILAVALLLAILPDRVAAQTTYTWNGGAGDWQTAANWTPVRSVPAANDLLVFNTAGAQAVSNVPTQTIGRLTITNGAAISLSGSAGGQTLTVGNGTGDDLVIVSGASLTQASSLETIALAGNATADVSGTYTNNGTFSLSAAGTVATVSGTLENTNTVSGSTTVKLNFTGTGTYIHNRNGGTIPTATWNATSNCNVTGMTTNFPSGTTQLFGNMTWNCASQSGSGNPASALTIAGNLTVQNTGSGQFRMGSPGTNTVGGDFTLNSGTVRINSSTTSYTLTVNGDFNMTGGTLIMSANAQVGTMNVAGDFTQSGGTITETNPSGTGAIFFNGGGTQIFTSGGTVTNTVHFTVNSGTTLQMAAAGTAVTGDGDFTLQAGATLGIRSAAGITASGATGNVQVTGTRSYSTGASYIYNGPAAQVTGNGLPATVSGLTTDNTGGVTLTNSVTVNDSLALGSILATGGNLTTVEDTAAVTRTTGHVNGNLRMNNALGASAKTFHIGDATTYAPVLLAFNNVGTAGGVTGFTTAGDHPDLGNTTFTPSETVNRYWTLNNNGTVFNNYDATFNWALSDEDAGFVSSESYCGKTNGSPNWTYPTMGTRTATSAQITGVTAFSDFQIGGGCPDITATLSGSEAICEGDTAEISVSLSAGTGPYTLQFTNGDMVNDYNSGDPIPVSPANTTTYELSSATDANGCTATVTGIATVTVSSLPACSIDGLTLVCANDPDILYNGPDGMDSYAWSVSGNATIDGAANNQTVTVDAGAAGTYTVTLTVTSGACGNTCSTTVTASQPVLYLSSASASSAVLCGDTVVVNITVDSGFINLYNVQYSLNWDPSLFKYIDHNALEIGSGGNPAIDVTNALSNGELVYVWTAPSITPENLPDGKEILSIRFIPLGSSGSSSVEITGSPVILEVSSENFCTGPIVPQNNVDILFSPIAVTCPPNDSVCISVAPFALEGGLPGGGVYSGPGVSGGVFDPDAAGAGVHTIVYTYTSPDGCVDSCAFEIAVGPAITTLSLSAPDPSCAGYADGAAAVVGVDGGTAPYFYLWNTNETTSGISGLTAGTYTVTVSDGYGCSLADSISIFDPPVLTAAILPDPANACVGVPFPLDGNPGGGTPDYVSHVWTGAGAASLDNTNIQSPSFTNATPGDYELVYTVTDANSCTATDTLLVTVHDGGELTLTAEGPAGPATCGDTIEVTVAVSDFTNIGALDYSVNWDDTELSLLGTTPLTIDGDVPVVNTPGAGQLTFAWFDADFAPYGAMLSDGTVILTLKFQVVTDGPLSGVNVDLSGTPISLNASTGFFCETEVLTENNVSFDVEPIEVLCPADLSVCAENLPLDLTTLGAAPAGGVFSGTGVTDTLYSAAGGTTNTVTYTYTDANGCTNSCTFNITVNSTPLCTIFGPEGVCPNSLDKFCGPADENLTYAWSIMGNGSITGPANEPCVQVQAGADCGESYSLFLTVTDTSLTPACTSTCMVAVAVEDTEMPTIACPQNDLVLECAADDYLLEINNWMEQASGSDNCAVSPVTTDWNDTDVPALSCDTTTGLTITFHVEDDCGNAAECLKTVYVTDTQTPSITCPADLTLECGVAGYLDSITAWILTAGLDDACDDTLTLSTDWDGSTVPDLSCDFYTGLSITFTVTDDCGNSAQCTRTVYLDDTVAPTLNCPDDLILECDGDYSAEIQQWIASATAFDACTGSISPTAELPASEPSLSCDTTQGLVVKFLVNDECGNSASCERTIFVVDTTVPEITCPENDTLECIADANYVSAIQNWIATAGATDNCGAPQITTDYDSQSAPPLSCDLSAGLSVTFTATDDCGNSAQCTRTVYLDDTTPPTITCPQDSLVLECGSDYAAQVEQWLAQASATDACDDAVDLANDWNSGMPTLSCGLSNGLVVMFVATDDCGNLATCFKTIYLDDTTPPTVTCPAADLVLECVNNADYVSQIQAWIATASASDGCDPSPALSSNYDNASVPSLSCNLSNGLTITFSAMDDCGNSTQCARTVYRDDTAAPTIFCPANLTLECADPKPDSMINAWILTASATDACDPNMTILTDWDGETIPALSCTGASGLNIVFSVSDDCGNSRQCTRTVFMDDTKAPAITCPADLTLECSTSTDYAAEIQAWAQGASATDACDASPGIDTDYDGTSAPPLSCDLAEGLTITFTAIDDCLNSAQCVRTVYLDDTTAPEITCPQDSLVLECDGDYTSEIQQWIAEASALDACDADPDITTDWDSGIPALSCDLTSGLVVTFTAADSCGNVTQCAKNIYLRDTTAPELDCPGNLVLECGVGTPLDSITAWIATAAASDACDDTPEVGTDWDGSTLPVLSCNLGTGLIITFTAKDDCGNTAMCSATVFLDDTAAPVLTCPADITILCHEDSGPMHTGVPSATDACDTEFAYDLSDIVTLGLCPQEKTIVRTWSTADDCGNTAVCEQTISVIDTIPPVLTCPENATVNCDDDRSPDALGYASAADVCDPSELTTDFADVFAEAACPQSGTLTRTWSAQDACGNVGTCVQTIEVVDTGAPVLTCPDDLVLECNVGNHVDSIAAWIASVVPTDACDNAPKLSTDWNGSAPTTLSCDLTNGLVITFTATDTCGNTAACKAAIFVDDTTSPVLTCPADITIECDEDPGPMHTGTPSATDNCDTEFAYDFSDASTPGNCEGERSILRAWSTQDDCGNTAACEQRIEVVDTTAPALSCPPDVTIECDEDTGPMHTGAPTGSDNCDGTLVFNFDDVATPGGCDQERTILRTWNTEDDCGNSTVCEQTITVQDNTPPQITCPPDVTVNCDESTEPANTGTPAIDDCDPQPGVAHDDSDPVPGDCPQEWTFVRSWIAIDNCGNISGCSHKITVVDETAPVLTCPGDVTVNCDDDTTPGTGAPTGEATATDNCDPAPEVTWSDVETAGVCPVVRIITRTWTAADACGNTTVCTQIISVEDHAGPDIVCPPDVTIQCDESIDPEINTSLGEATATDACDLSVVVAYVDFEDPGTCPQERFIKRVWGALDDCNNASACAQQITVVDTKAPVWSTLPGELDRTLECHDTTGLAAAQLLVPSGADNCDLYLNAPEKTPGGFVPGACPQAGTYTNTWTLTDACGNVSDTFTQTITILDTIAPVWQTPAGVLDITLECSDSTGLADAQNAAPVAFDLCDPNVSVEKTAGDFVAGACPQAGTYTNTWLATDACSNESTVFTQVITIQDTQPPTMVCEENVAVVLGPDGTVTIAPEDVDAGSFDACGDLTFELSLTTFDCDDLGENFVELTATDECGNSNVCLTTVTVTDTISPVITCPATQTQSLDEFCEASLADYAALAVVDDNCPTEVSQSPSPGTLYSGEQSVIVTLTATDGAGNSSQCTFEVLIEDNTLPQLACPPDVTLYTASQSCNALTGWTVPVPEDNCGVDPQGSTFTVQPPNGNIVVISGSAIGLFDKGVHVLTYTALDVNGNTGTCAFTVTVLDTFPPVITGCPADITVNTTADDCSGTATWTAPTASDNCPGVSLGTNHNPGESFPVGQTTVLYTATDAEGQTTTCQFTVTVTDLIAPVIETCPADSTLEGCGTDALTGLPYSETETGVSEQDFAAAGGLATDVCGVDSVTYVDAATGECPLLVTRTWIVRDVAGNSAICEQQFTIEDTEAPQIQCPANLSLACGDEANPAILQNWLNSASAEDGCTGTLTPENDFDSPGLPLACDQPGGLVVTFTAADYCGNTAFCSAAIFLIDTLAPEITCPPPVTVECDASLDPEQNTDLGLPTASDACDPDPDTDYADVFAEGECPQERTVTRTWTVYDDCQNSASCVQTISVEDNTAPSLTCPPAITVDCNVSTDPFENDTLGIATAEDNCDGQPVVSYSDQTTPAACNGQLIIRTWTAVDTCGNSTNCAQGIAVTDLSAPEITCPPTDTVECDQSLDPLVNFNLDSATADDNCDPEPTVTYSDESVSGNCPDLLVVTRTWTAQDICNNSTTCVQVIHVQDTTPPNFTVPEDLTLSLGLDCTVDLSNLGEVNDATDNCDLYVSPSFSDSIVPGPGASERRILRTWVVEDDCGNRNVQTQTIVIQDDTPPSIDCPADLTVMPNTSECNFLFEGSDFDPDASDNCGIDSVAYTLSGATTATGTGSLDGAVFNVGMTVVTWTAVDINGNTAICSFVVTVENCLQISGQLIWEGDDTDQTGVALATVDLSGDDTDTDGPTAANGAYTLTASTGSNFTVTPTKPAPLADPLNGVSTLDALLVQQYIIGIYTFGDAYKMIAADVNLSNAITTLDASTIRQALLGHPGALEIFNDHPWRFVPTPDNTPYSLGYTPATDPFSAPIPATRVLTGLAGPSTGENFYGIKTGDVNATGDPLLHPAASIDPLIWKVQDQLLESDGEILVWFKATQFESLGGYQFALQFDTAQLQLLAVESGTSALNLSLGGNFGLFNAAAGEIRHLWVNPQGKTLPDGEQVFALRFRALKSGAWLHEVLQLKQKTLAPEAYRVDHAIGEVQLFFTEPPVPTDVSEPGVQALLLQNRPNPFSHRTVIGFELPAACDATLRVLDVQGRELYRIDRAYTAGYHEETILLKDLHATGVLYCELRTPFGVLVRKMMAARP